jgi:ribosomal protein S18 acetylase RimI-like enzyme
MDLSIRPMVIEDYNDVLQIWENTEGIVLSETDARDPLKRFLERNPSLSLVAYLGSEMVGAVLCSHDGRRGYLHHLAVDKRYRRIGIGTALVRTCLWALSKEQITKCNIFFIEENDEGIAFWQHNGFRLLEHFGWMQKQITGDEEPPKELYEK